MKIHPGHYPPDWPEISHRIRFDRAGSRCECHGECGHAHPGGRCNAPHGVLVYRPHEAPWQWQTEADVEAHPVRIILSTAHLDHDRRNNADDNLRALCQFCHLNHDRLHRAALKRQRAIEAGQLELEWE